MTNTSSDFNPSEHNVDEVVEHLEAHPDEADAIAAAEAEGKDRVTVAEAVEKVKASKSSKRKPRSGTHTLEAGDSPANVARNLYGRASLGRELVAANPGVKWRSGVEITLPDI